MFEWIGNIWLVKNVLIPLFDIGILSFLLFKGYQILVQTRAVQLVKGTATLLIMYGIAYVFQLSTLLWIMNLLVPGLVIGIVIIFQPELRKIFTRLGQKQLFKHRNKNQELPIDDIVRSARYLSEMQRGALIVFSRSVGLKNIIETGSKLDCLISAALINSIFSYDTDLHDGALIIENGRISSAGSFLPLSEQQDIRKSFGTRHRAALGIAEETDAVVLVVSEETGALSLAYDAALYYNMELIELKARLMELLEIKPSNLDEVENED